MVAGKLRVAPQARLPEWLRRPPGSHPQATEVKQLLRRVQLNTVCEEARCPNIGECFSKGTATFLIMGSRCTRGCRFCSVEKGRPSMAEEEFQLEAQAVAEAAATLGLSHVVVTSVTRDDLSDGGASGFVATICALRAMSPKCKVEVLVPDFAGSSEALLRVLEAEPDVLNHNLETVPRLYPEVRPGADYQRSLELLSRAAKHANPSNASQEKVLIKTGIMLGLGETASEVQTLMEDALNAGVKMFTAGQYMRPSSNSLPVARYLLPEEFVRYDKLARDLGFTSVAVGALVRSSYHAAEFLQQQEVL